MYTYIIYVVTQAGELRLRRGAVYVDLGDDMDYA